MQIEPKMLYALVPELGMTLGAATRIVRMNYCGPMTVRSTCPGLCVECQDRLLKAFNLVNARNVQALLTYNLKLAVAEVKEKQSEAKPTPKKTTSLFPIQESPFTRLANEISSTPR